VYGIDPASKNDYTGCVIHAIPQYEIGVPHVPFIKDLFNIRFLPFDKLLFKLQSEYFPHYPPTLIVTDYTNEKTFTDLLVTKYGEQRVEPYNFTNQSKLLLKQDGLSIMNMGYQFPNWKRVKDPQRQEWGFMLENQLQMEQLLTKADHTQRFDHPVGEHNDLSTAWELSIHGCLRYLLNKGGEPIISTGEPRYDSFNDMDTEDFFPELKGMSNVTHQFYSS
jgi:hypothetical protein